MCRRPSQRVSTLLTAQSSRQEDARLPTPRGKADSVRASTVSQIDPRAVRRRQRTRRTLTMRRHRVLSTGETDPIHQTCSSAPSPRPRSTLRVFPAPHWPNRPPAPTISSSALAPASSSSTNSSGSFPRKSSGTRSSIPGADDTHPNDSFHSHVQDQSLARMIPLRSLKA
jgi:hypothetical protein